LTAAPRNSRTRIVAAKFPELPDNDAIVDALAELIAESAVAMIRQQMPPAHCSKSERDGEANS
jgi:hypothetical protein